MEEISIENMEEISIENEVFSTRLLVFLEDSPQSNKYHQVYFSPEEFKKMSMTVGKVISIKGGEQQVEVKFSDEVYDLPDLQEIHG